MIEWLCMWFVAAHVEGGVVVVQARDELVALGGVGGEGASEQHVFVVLPDQVFVGKHKSHADRSPEREHRGDP